MSTGRISVTIAALALVAGCAVGASERGPNTTERSASAPSPIVGKIVTRASLKEPMPTVATMARAASVVAVVRGRIASITWEHDGTLARTAYRVNVTQTLKGEVPAEIVVREDGGYLEAAEVQRENQDKFPASRTPATGFVDVTFEGASHPQVGEDVVLFLQHDPNVGRESGYVLVGSSFGRFVSSGDTYRRAAVQDGWESSLTLASLQSYLHG